MLGDAFPLKGRGFYCEGFLEHVARQLPTRTLFKIQLNWQLQRLYWVLGSKSLWEGKAGCGSFVIPQPRLIQRCRKAHHPSSSSQPHSSRGFLSVWCFATRAHAHTPKPRFDPPLLHWRRTTCVSHVTQAPMGWLHMVLSTRELVLIRKWIPWCVFFD